MKELLVHTPNTGTPNARPHDGEPQPEVLVPLDFTPCSREALHTAIGYAKRLKARIVLLHVIDVARDFLNAARADVPRIEQELRDQANAEFAWAKDTYRESGVPFENVIVEGLPSEQILNTVAARSVEMIVIGKHPSSKPWNLFHRQTVKDVVAKAHCEVIVVMHKGKSKHNAAFLKPQFAF